MYFIQVCQILRCTVSTVFFLYVFWQDYDPPSEGQVIRRPHVHHHRDPVLSLLAKMNQGPIAPQEVRYHPQVQYCACQTLELYRHPPQATQGLGQSQLTFQDMLFKVLRLHSAFTLWLVFCKCLTERDKINYIIYWLYTLYLKTLLRNIKYVFFLFFLMSEI